MSYADAIAAAGYNVLNLRPEEIEMDLATDVPSRSPLAEIRDAGNRAQYTDLDAAARRLYGDHRFVFVMKGRSAELALARAVIRPGMFVLTTGLFRTTQRALTTQGAKVDVMPARFRTPGTSDLSLDWLHERFAAGEVAAVMLEPANNAMFGWPMQLEHLRAVKAACASRGTKLYLDAARLMANCELLGAPMAEYLALADAFVTSCAKECLVPMGAIVGMRDLDLQRQVWLNAFEEGANLEAQPLCAQLGAGLDTIRTQPAIIANRRRQLVLLAEKLHGAGIRYIEPIGANAVWALIPSWVTNRPLHNHELQAHVFATTGIRFLFARHPEHSGFVVRLPLQLARYNDTDLDRIVAALASADPATVPGLVVVPSDCIHQQYFGRYAVAA